MALSLFDRVSIAENDNTFRLRVKGAATKHAKHIIRTSEDEELVTASRAALRSLQSYLGLLGAAALTEPLTDNLESAEALTDESLQERVAEVWPVVVLS